MVLFGRELWLSVGRSCACVGIILTRSPWWPQTTSPSVLSEPNWGSAWAFLAALQKCCPLMVSRCAARVWTAGGAGCGRGTVATSRVAKFGCTATAVVVWASASAVGPTTVTSAFSLGARVIGFWPLARAPFVPLDKFSFLLYNYGII